MRRAMPVLFCLAAVGCGDPLAPLPNNGPPRALVYEYSGWPDFYTRVELVGDTVLLASRTYPPGGPATSTTRRVPSTDEWRAFWAAMRDAGVRRWPGRCVNESVLDGGGYEFTLAWDGGRRTGTHFNAAPTRAGRCSDNDFTDSERFRGAVLAVAGAEVLGARRAWRR